MKIVSLLLVCMTVSALQPSRLPNGDLKRFCPNKQTPCTDLKSVESYEATIIAKHWANNIAVQPILNKEDKHILDRIERFNEFSRESRDPRYVHLLWVPDGVNYEVLFMVLVHVNGDTDTLTVSLLIPSPFWDSSQIESTELKRALEDLATQSKKRLDLSGLYRNDIRFKLAWKDW